MIGMVEAVNQLLVALEVQPVRPSVSFGAGYEKEVDEFLTVNPGFLAGPGFNRKFTVRVLRSRRAGRVDCDPATGRNRGATVIEPARARKRLKHWPWQDAAGLPGAGRHARDRRHAENGTFSPANIVRAALNGYGTPGWAAQNRTRQGLK